MAEVHYWHGYDRLIAGLGEYYSQLPTANGQRQEVYFHIVGGVGPSEMYDSMHAPGFHELMETYQIQDKVKEKYNVNGHKLFSLFFSASIYNF